MKRKRADEAAYNEENEDAEEGNEEEREEAEEVQVDFEFFDPKEEDYHSIKYFLKNLLGGEEFDVGGLADHVARQTRTGTVVKIEEDDFGFISVVNVHKHADLTCMKEIKAFLLEEAPEKERKMLEALFADTSKPLGLVLSERLPQVPEVLAYWLNTALFQEVEWATEDEVS